MHHLTPLAALGAGLVAWGIVTSAPPAAGQAPSSPRAPSTERMAERLEAIARDSALANPYESWVKVQALRGLTPRPTLTDQLGHRAQLATWLLNAGSSHEAAREAQGILRDAQANPGVMSSTFMNGVREFLAISYLRIDAQENCVRAWATQRCSLPISREAIHPNQDGSRRAIEHYTQILANPPDDLSALSAQWLLNIAYMTLGEHPSQVPQRWRIPAEAFRSAYDITPFPDVAPRLGLDIIGRAGGSVMDDFDGDGDLDIMASSVGLRDQLRAVRNNGDGTFTDVTLAAGLEGIVGGLNLVQADYNNDGFLDLLVLRGGWLNEGHPNSLLRNNGDGTFSDVTEEAGMLAPAPTQTAAWGDYDNDGWLDLFVTGWTDDMEEVLQSALSGTPSQERNRLALYHNNGDGTFTDVTTQAGLARTYGAMAAQYGDVDNDGYLDIYLGTGAPPMDTYEPNKLLWNTGMGTFLDVTESAGVGNLGKGHGATFSDYDNDGDLDLFAPIGGALAGDRQPNSFYRNNGTPHHWVKLRLIATTSNPDAIGARVQVTTELGNYYRAVATGTGLGSMNDPMIMVGLGAATRVEQVTIDWPSGVRQEFSDLAADQVIEITEGNATLRQTAR